MRSETLVGELFGTACRLDIGFQTLLCCVQANLLFEHLAIDLLVVVLDLCSLKLRRYIPFAVQLKQRSQLLLQVCIL